MVWNVPVSVCCLVLALGCMEEKESGFQGLMGWQYSVLGTYLVKAHLPMSV